MRNVKATVEMVVNDILKMSDEALRQEIDLIDDLSYFDTVQELEGFASYLNDRLSFEASYEEVCVTKKPAIDRVDYERLDFAWSEYVPANDPVFALAA